MVRSSVNANSSLTRDVLDGVQRLSWPVPRRPPASRNHPSEVAPNRRVSFQPLVVRRARILGFPFSPWVAFRYGCGQRVYPMLTQLTFWEAETGLLRPSRERCSPLFCTKQLLRKHPWRGSTAGGWLADTGGMQRYTKIGFYPTPEDQVHRAFLPRPASISHFFLCAPT